MTVKTPIHGSSVPGFSVTLEYSSQNLAENLDAAQWLQDWHWTVIIDCDGTNHFAPHKKRWAPHIVQRRSNELVHFEGDRDIVILDHDVTLESVLVTEEQYAGKPGVWFYVSFQKNGQAEARAGILVPYAQG